MNEASVCLPLSPKSESHATRYRMSPSEVRTRLSFLLGQTVSRSCMSSVDVGVDGVEVDGADVGDVNVWEIVTVTLS